MEGMGDNGGDNSSIKHSSSNTHQEKPLNGKFHKSHKALQADLAEYEVIYKHFCGQKKKISNESDEENHNNNNNDYVESSSRGKAACCTALRAQIRNKKKSINNGHQKVPMKSNNASKNLPQFPVACKRYRNELLKLIHSYCKHTQKIYAYNNSVKNGARRIEHKIGNIEQQQNSRTPNQHQNTNKLPARPKSEVSPNHSPAMNDGAPLHKSKADGNDQNAK
ncbi:hypothetical protein niasHS_002943 [Heterodera schachtii]|uniref:Uncharacterized protein n=1 Tax=Heterodera schachtii TaxID=97005 RepID=A0ABD2K9W7_HETSC